MNGRRTPPDELPIAVVTAVSGAGKTTALQALEDVGFLAVDNAPPRLWPALADAAREASARGLALGYDLRATAWGDDAATVLAELGRRGTLRALFLDADDAALIQRFNFTRRTHPLGEASLSTDLATERDALAPLRGAADEVIDTSAMSARDLTRAVWRRFAGGQTFGLRLLSFGYKRGLPTDADAVLDVRGLSNPYYDPRLRPLPGTDSDVQGYVFDDDGLAVYAELRATARRLANLARDAGRTSYTVAVGCTGGQHRSVAVVERLAHDLADALALHVEHRDMELALAEHGAHDEHATRPATDAPEDGARS